MALAEGDRLGPYEIVGHLGAGGMGEVFRARDTRLDRLVALKILPDSWAHDAVSRARFEREAKAVAALSHPNILAIYDFGEENDLAYAAMELLEGQTLRQRLGGQALPTSKAVEIALGIARALAAAHDREIVHRDLKPENVFLTLDGQVKVLDFGMARFRPPVAEEATAALSRPGAMFGTIEYMSPEQLRSEPTDGRADVFALGMVLYEMVAGRRPFQRQTLPDTMSAILTEDPEPFDADARPLPPALAQILHRCLEKRPEERFQSTHDLAFALASLSTVTSVMTTLPPPQTAGARWRSWWPAAAALLAVALAFGLGRMTTARRPANSRAPTFAQLTYLPGVETSPSIGPGGRAFVYQGDAAGNADIYIQRVGPYNPINLTPDSPDDDTAPAVSPDGQHVAFRSERLGGGIFVMGATGESVRRVTDFGFDPVWSPDGSKLVVSTEPAGDPLSKYTSAELWVVRLADGQRRRLSEGDAVQPSWSPDGSRIAFWASDPTSGQRDIFTIPASGGAATAVTNDDWLDWNPVWSPDGEHLYFVTDRGGTMNLWRIAIDEASGSVLSEPEPVITPSVWSGNISFSDTGQLVYATRHEESTLYRVEFDPRSERIGAPVPFLRSSRVVDDITLSPDGKWIAFTTGGLREDLFLVGSDGSGYRQLTDDAFRDRGPKWSPDGRRIAFYSNRAGRYEVWSARPDGTLEQMTQSSGDSPWFPTWSPSGDRFATSNATAVSIYTTEGPLGERKVLDLPAMPGARSFMASSWSPDSRLLAGHSLREGSLAEGIYLYDLETGDFHTQTGSGFHPLWLGDSRRLLVWAAGGLSLLERGSSQVKELLPETLVRMGWRNFDISADDRLVVFLKTTQQADIWLMNPGQPRPGSHSVE